MGVLVIVAVVALGLLLLPGLLAKPETSLFRRVWSSERLGGPYGAEKQDEAVQALMTTFGINFDQSTDVVREGIGKLLAAATEFDVRYRNNLGVQTMPVLARELLRKKGQERHPELTKELSDMCRVDGLGLMDALSRRGPA